MTEQYKNILVTVDGSDQSYNAVREAVEVAKRNDAELTILTVKDIRDYYGWVATGDMLETPGLDRRAQEIIYESEKFMKHDIPYHTEIIAGNPKNRIVQYAKNEDIDLIIMGDTGLGFFDKLIIGSTTQYVVNHAPCNVMVVK